MEKMEQWAFKILLIGAAGVGKSSLVRRFIDNEFTENLAATLGVDYKNKEVEFIPENTARLTIWDIGGQERFKFLRNTFYLGANGALIVFDLTREQTFRQLENWIYEMDKLVGERIPFIIIGNKSDLLEDVGEVISAANIRRFAEIEESAYIETSAKTGDNVEEAFVESARRMAKIQDIRDVFPEQKEDLPRTPLEAQRLLIKALYTKFGKEALPVIQEVMGKQGKALGLEARKKLEDHSLEEVAKAFGEFYKSELLKLKTLSKNKILIRCEKCPYELEDTSLELCYAVMELDREFYSAALGEKVEVVIVDSSATGDPYCVTTYETKREK